MQSDDNIFWSSSKFTRIMVSILRASKAGLDMWTRSLPDEGSNDGISAVSVAPGIVDTDMQATIRSVSIMIFQWLEIH